MRKQSYPDFMRSLRAYFGSPARPPFSVAYRRTCHVARIQGWSAPSISTARRLIREAA